MVFQKIINGLINIKESLIKNKSLILYIFLIILFQLLMHFFVYSNIFGNIGFFCGDTPNYSLLANNINHASNYWPSGFPFVLHMLFYISRSPLFLIAFSVFISVATSIFFFLTVRYLLKNKNLISFLITIFFFLNPTITYIDSMVYMPDSFAFFLFSVGTYLILIDSKKPGFNLKYLIAGLIFGYLTIVKNAFIYLFPFIILYIFYKIYKNNKKFSIKNLLKYVVILILFASIPLSYTYLFNKPYLGIARLENFGGRSSLANILPHVSCEQLLSVATTDIERDSITKNCNDSEMNKIKPVQQLWNGKSPMNKMSSEIIYDNDKIKINQLFQKWLIAIIFKYPMTVFYTVENTMVNGYLGEIISDQILIKQHIQMGTGCEQFAPRILNMDLKNYEKGWSLHQQNNKFSINLISFMQLNIGKITNWIIAILFLILIPFYAIYKKIISSEFIFLYMISAVYVFIISLGSYFDSRYYIIFNYLILLSACSLMVIKKPGSKK